MRVELGRKGLFLLGWARSWHNGFLKPTGSLPVEQFPGDSYLNIRKPSEGLPEAQGSLGEVPEERI